MKKNLHDFIDGDSTKKLAIISDFSTILGVSIATFVAGPFLSKFNNQEFIISDFILAIAFYFVYLYIVLSIFYSYVKSFFQELKEKKYTNLILSVPMILFITWLIIILFPFAKSFIGNTFNVSYLLPPTAKNAIIKIKDIQIYDNQIKGQFIFKNTINALDYVALLYAKNNKNNKFEIIKHGSSSDDYKTIIRQNGEFVIPIKLYEDYTQYYLAVYRSSDWELITALTARYGFPNNLSYFPNSDTDKLEAFVVKIKSNKPE